MNILLWVLQVLLAFWNITGGMYTISNYEKIRSAWASGLPHAVWVTIGGLQILFAIGVLVPGVVGILPKLTSFAALYLALNSLAGCVLAAPYAGFPGMLWGVIPAAVAAFVAYGRMG